MLQLPLSLKTNSMQVAQPQSKIDRITRIFRSTRRQHFGYALSGKRVGWLYGCDLQSSTHGGQLAPISM